MSPEIIEIAYYTGTRIPCGISRATVLPSVLTTPGSGLSVRRALKNIEEVLPTPDPPDHVLGALDDLRALINAVK